MSKSAYQKANPGLRSPKIQHIRHVKPEYFVHEGVNDMTVNARLAEIGTWTCCDKHGRFEWLPRMLKRMVMPYDNVDFESLMMEWVNHGFAERYEVDGKSYGRFFNWEKHQGINLREKQSCFEYPAPSHVSARASTVQAPITHVQARVMSEEEVEVEGEVECKSEQEREGEPEVAPGALRAAVAVDSNPKALSPSLDSSAESKATAGGHKQASAAEYVDQVIARAKVLSDGKASFSKTAKADMIEALRQLGTMNESEIDYAIRARLALCTDDVSYAIFGSSLAADFVASVRAYRERIATEKKEQARLAAQEKRARGGVVCPDCGSDDLMSWGNGNFKCNDCGKTPIIPGAIAASAPVVESKPAPIKISASMSDEQIRELFKQHGVGVKS
jgi:hypothetical protein